MRTTFHIDEVMCAAFIDDRDTPCTLLGPVSVLALVRFLQGVDVMAATRDGGRGLGFASNPAAQLPMLIFVALRGDDLLRRP